MKLLVQDGNSMDARLRVPKDLYVVDVVVVKVVLFHRAPQPFICTT